MTVAAFPQLIDAVVAALRAAQTLSGVMIYDGIEIDSSDPTDWISIGHDGSEDGEVVAANLQNNYKQLGAKSMYEDGSINCTLSSWTGETNLSVCRTRAYSLLSKVDTVIRTDPSFGGIVLWSGLDTHTPTYIQASQGAAVQVNFTIYYKART
jgi:hypothetical protein